MKRQREPICEEKILEHGIGTNLMTFLSIIESRYILSPRKAEEWAHQHHRRFVTPHMNPTGGRDQISLSIPGTISSHNYSRNGITFLIQTDHLDCHPSRSTIPGEIYVANEIPLENNLIAIYIPSQIKDQLIRDLDLCQLAYGSRGTIDVSDLLATIFQVDPSLQPSLSHLRDAWNRVYSDGIKWISQKRQQLESLNLSQLEFRSQLSLVQKHAQNVNDHRYQRLGNQCRQLLLEKLTIDLNLQNLDQMSLTQFIKTILIKFGINRPIIHTL